MSRNFNLDRSGDSSTETLNEIMEEPAHSSPVNVQKKLRNSLKAFQNMKTEDGQTVKISAESPTKSLKEELWMPSKAQTQCIREPITSLLQVEQQPVFAKNSNDSWNQEEAKSNSFTSWKASNNLTSIPLPRIWSPKVKLGQWRSKRLDSDNVKHFEEEPSDKTLAMDREEVARIFQAIY